ncbi:hypothetical protein E4T39_03736 [Aureobasidium subglaciale]|nr:hypothetical protein E4T39_03736 [Aureobasidium subglaciale]
METPQQRPCMEGNYHLDVSHPPSPRMNLITAYSQPDFTEGLFIDYKRFHQQDITPRFAFGYGLTCSNFSYSSLRISVNGTPPGTTSGIAREGGISSLYDNIATISVSGKDSGSIAAAEVAQLYLGKRDCDFSIEKERSECLECGWTAMDVASW